MGVLWEMAATEESMETAADDDAFDATHLEDWDRAPYLGPRILARTGAGRRGSGKPPILDLTPTTLDGGRGSG